MSLLILGVYKAGTRIGLVFFGPVFFLAAHLVESSVIALELYFEHRNYLPSVGIFISLGLAGYFAYERVVTQLQALLMEGKSEDGWGLEWRLYFDTARLLALLDRKREAVELLTSAGAQHDQVTSGLLAVRYLLDLGDHTGARRMLDSLQARDGQLTRYQRQMFETFREQL